MRSIYWTVSTRRIYAFTGRRRAHLRPPAEEPAPQGRNANASSRGGPSAGRLSGVPAMPAVRFRGASATAALVLARAALAGEADGVDPCWRPPVLALVEQDATPVLTVRSADAEGIKYGFEGGRAVKVEGA